MQLVIQVSVSVNGCVTVQALDSKPTLRTLTEFSIAPTMKTINWMKFGSRKKSSLAAPRHRLGFLCGVQGKNGGTSCSFSPPSHRSRRSSSSSWTSPTHSGKSLLPQRSGATLLGLTARNIQGKRQHSGRQSVRFPENRDRDPRF